jgi:zinc protease
LTPTISNKSRGLASAACRAVLAAWLLASASTTLAALPIQTWRAPSGAEVLFVEARTLPMIDVAVEFPAGSSRDDPGKGGLARMTLQMMKLGAGGMSETEISNRLADSGVRLGASFDVDRAGYAVRTLSRPDRQEHAFSVLEALLAAPAFEQRVFEREKARTLTALSESLTRPGTIVEREFLSRTYAAHPYGHLATGDPQTVGVLTRNDLVEFYRHHYVADRAIIAIIGDLSRAQAQRIAQRLTEKLPRSRVPRQVLPPVPRLSGPIESYIPHPASQAHLRIGAPGLRRGDPDYYALWLGNQVLGGGGFNSRLSVELREKRGLTYSAYSYFAPFAVDGPFVLGAQTSREQAPAALSVMRETLERFVRDGPSEVELQEAKQNVVGGFVLRVDSNEKILEYLSLIGFYDLPLDYIERFPHEIEKVTLQQVRDAFRRRIDPARMVTVVVGPRAGS